MAEGFSIFAFVFSFPWFLVHRLWREAGVVFAGLVFVIFIIAGGEIADPLGNALRMIFSIGVGMFAHDTWCAALRRKGWRDGGLVAAESKGEAETIYFSEYVGPAEFEEQASP